MGKRFICTTMIFRSVFGFRSFGILYDTGSRAVYVVLGAVADAGGTAEKDACAGAEAGPAEERARGEEFLPL